MSSWFGDPKIVIALIAAAGGWVSATVAWNNGRTARTQLQLVRDQEERRASSLRPYLVEGCHEAMPGFSRYAFSIRVQNPSDRPNSIAAAVLAIRYRATGLSTLEARVAQLDAHRPEKLKVDIENRLQLPINVASNQSVAGLLIFDVDADVVNPTVIEDYKLELIDTFDRTTSISMILLREL